MEEYGGGAAIAYGGAIYFSNFGDLGVYKLDVGNGGEPVAVTPGNPSSSGIRSFDHEEPGVGGDLQRTRTTDSQISPYCLPTLTSLLRFSRITHIQPHRTSKPLSYSSIRPPKPSHRWSPERTFTPHLGSHRMGSTQFGSSGIIQTCLGRVRRYVSQR